MSSALTKSLDVHAWFYQRFETIAITWVPGKRVCRHVSKTRQLILWTLNTFLATVLVPGFSIFILTKQLLSPSLIYSYEVLIVQLLFCLFAGFWIFVFVASILYGKTFVTVWNFYRRLLLEARRKLPCKFKFFKLSFK